jgi:putative toxin-antitoxin system antitoxin component (TIGR02293 family)
LASATVNRKSRDQKPLSSDESSRVIGMARLVGQVQAMVEESGDPEGFDAATWVAEWLEQPLPALGGRRPAELMDTPEGQNLVSNLVARLQTGAYA